MSDEHIERVRAVYAKWGAGDFRTPEVFDDASEVVWAQEMPLAGESSRGLEEITAGMLEWLGPWEEFSWTGDEFIAAEDKVLVLVTARGRGKGSTVTVEARWAHLWTFREGRVARVEGFLDPADGRRAAGLEA